MGKKKKGLQVGLNDRNRKTGLYSLMRWKIANLKEIIIESENTSANIQRKYRDAPTISLK